MQVKAFDVLIGLRLSIVRRAADMLVLQFGDIRPHVSGEGTVGEYALHVQCPWRFDGPHATVTGRDDLWQYAGPGERPLNWSYEDGLSVQDHRLGTLFDRDESTRSWVNERDRFVVHRTEQTKRGDIKLELSDGYAILLFPASYRSEAWRFFATGGDEEHVIFPSTVGDYAISRRNAPRTSEQWEAWLTVVEAPKAGSAMHAPPIVILTTNGTRHRCGRCGAVLAIAESGALKGFVIHCRRCDSYNEVRR
jgi:hypothetical protein